MATRLTAPNMEEFQNSQQFYKAIKLNMGIGGKFLRLLVAQQLLVINQPLKVFLKMPDNQLKFKDHLRKKILHKKQLKVLHSKDVSLEKMDSLLLIYLLLNIFQISSQNQKDITELRICRNEIVHDPNAQLRTDDVFNRTFDRLKSICRELDCTLTTTKPGADVETYTDQLICDVQELEKQYLDFADKKIAFARKEKEKKKKKKKSNLADAAEPQSLASPQTPEARETFKSRFCDDFETIKVLGRGASGVVFEAENKLDLRRYAVKRVKIKGMQRPPLCQRFEALARLDNPGIVRYFNSWMETPPRGWQAEQDSRVDGLSNLTCTDDYPTKNSPERQSEDETSKNLTIAYTAPSRNPQFADLDNFGANNFTDFFVYDVRPHDKASESSGWSPDEWSSLDTPIKDTKYDFYNEEEDDENDVKQAGKDGELPEENDDDEDDVFENSEAFRKRKTEEVQKKAENNSDDTTEVGGSMDRKAHDSDREDQNLQQLRIYKPSLPVPHIFLYIQTELCKAETLQDWLDETKIRPLDTIVNILREITSALAYIHNKQYIHRDLKPANVFFALDNSVKIGDFGLSKIMAEDNVESLDNEGVVNSLTSGVGTPFYMSPEQRGTKYTNKVDIFALGVILFEMFHSFDSRSERAEMLEAARRLDFPEQFQVKHVQWCDTVRKMLSTEPDDRPTAQELLVRDLLRT